MRTEHLIEEFKQLTEINSLEDIDRMLDLFSDYLLKVTMEHRTEHLSPAENDALMLNHMILSKVLNLRMAVRGAGLISQTGEIAPTVDQTIVASISRNLYETVGLFNLIYVRTKNVEEREFLYSLWVISGLKYRQRFAPIATLPANIKKIKTEKTQIDLLTEKIRNSSIYKGLALGEQLKIENQIKAKNFKVAFENNIVVVLNWSDLGRSMGMKDAISNEIYNYFSQYAHPSNVSVFTFRDMYGNGGEGIRVLTNVNLQYCFFLLGSFVADYLKVFPQIKIVFDSQSDLAQIMLNFFNVVSRGPEFSINDKWKLLGEI